MPRLRASDLVLWRHCRKKFEYKLARGWKVDDGGREASIGTAFHAGVAAAYSTGSLDEGFEALVGDQLSREEHDLVCDMLRYYWENKRLDIAEVIATEKEIEFTLLCPVQTPQGPAQSPFTIVSHLDLVARDSQGQLLVVDHKTKTRMPGGYEWFQLATQMKVYAVAAWQEYGEVPKITHNIVRQAVPPGFGHHEFVLKKDGTPSKRQASTDPQDYLRQFSFLKSEDTMRFYRDDLRGLCSEIIFALMGAVRFERNEGILCERCPYLTACLIEDGGERLSDTQASLLFNTHREEETEETTE